MLGVRWTIEGTCQTKYLSAHVLQTVLTVAIDRSVMNSTLCAATSIFSAVSRLPFWRFSFNFTPSTVALCANCLQTMSVWLRSSCNAEQSSFSCISRLPFEFTCWREWMNLDSIREICQKCDVSHCACLEYTWCSFGNVKGALLGERSNLPSALSLFWRDSYKCQTSQFPCLSINDLHWQRSVCFSWAERHFSSVSRLLF